MKLAFFLQVSVIVLVSLCIIQPTHIQGMDLPVLGGSVMPKDREDRQSNQPDGKHVANKREKRKRGEDSHIKHTCFLCVVHRSFNTLQHFQEHQRAVHYKIKDKICKFCGLAFPRTGDKNRHEQMKRCKVFIQAEEQDNPIEPRIEPEYSYEQLLLLPLPLPLAVKTYVRRRKFDIA